MKILIIEDEMKSAKELQNILSEIDSSYTTIAILDSVESSVEYLSNNPPPDLIFSDIQLADGMCFEIYKKINVKSPIIFCTAYDEYVMEAFDTNAISYVLKPTTKDKISNAIRKLGEMKSALQESGSMAKIEELTHQLKYSYKSTLLVNHKSRIIPIPVKNIAFFYLDATIVKLTTVDKNMYVVTSTLDQVERFLDPALFFRANRQFLINRNAIASIERYFSRKLVAILMVETPESVLVSKAKASEFLQWLESSTM